ncbi:MAG: ArnT family glycosyltransferase [bacterium]
MMHDHSKFDSRNYLLFILLAAFILRLSGIGYGLPALYNSDEPFNVVNALSYGAKKSLEPSYFVYPSLYSYFLFAIFGLYFVAGKMLGVFVNAVDFGVSYFLNPTGLFFAGRLASVLLGVATVWLVFKIGQRFFSNKIGLFASAILTFSFIHADLSHWILLEPAVGFLTALALYFIFRFSEDHTLKMNILAGFVSGLAISTKYNAGFIFVPLLISIILIYKKQISRLFLQVSLSISALLLGFFLGTPYWVLSFSKYWAEVKYTLTHVGVGMVGHLSSLPFVWPLWQLLYRDWSIGLLLVAGFIYVVFQREKKQLLLVSFVLATVLFVGAWQRTGVHYLLPIFPALAILAAIFCNDMIEQIPGKSYRVGVVVLLFIAPLLKIGLHDIRLTQQDSRTFAQKWIEANISEGSVIGYENYVYGPNLFDPLRYFKNASESVLLPVEIKERLLKERRLRTSYQLINLRKDFKLRNFTQSNPDSNFKNDAYIRQLLEMRLPKLATIKRAGIEYIITSSDNYERYFESRPPKRGTPLWLSYQNGRKFYQSIINSEDLILLKEFRATFWNAGPIIRVYKFKS